jgi:hypothetical protein
MDKKAKIIALYLPQYHPTPSNDLWWENGFTEWTNVRKAKPLFKGHKQPKIPSEDLGYYDLRKSEDREKQALLAKEGGVDAFCYYHYWFGEDRRELELPFNEVVKSGKPNFPFCLCWANESWYSKLWNKDGTSNNKLLVEQKYLGVEDYEKHFYKLLPAFKDSRYLKNDGKTIFMIYKPLLFNDVEIFISLWNKLAKENGLEGVFFVGQTAFDTEIEVILSKGFDAINMVRLYEVHRNQSLTQKIKRKITNIWMAKPFVYSYEKALELFVGNNDKINNVYPSIIPNWDHTPRSKVGGFVLHGSTPELFRKHVKSVLENIKSKPKEHQIVFLKSWNEWGEGNYMEPDNEYGKAYINILKEEVS